MTAAASSPGGRVAPAGALSAAARGGWAAVGIGTWLGLLLVGLNLVHDPTVHDKTLVPRLHALVIVMLATLPTLALPQVAGRLDRGVLREPIVLCAVGYAAWTAASLLGAVNATAGVVDVVRTTAATLVLVVACLLLPLVPRWPERLLRWMVVAALVTATLGWHELVTKHGLGLHPRGVIEDVSGRMGNVNLLSGYLVLLVPVCAAAACLLGGPSYAASSQHAHWVAAFQAAMDLPMPEASDSELAFSACGLGRLAVCWACCSARHLPLTPHCAPGLSESGRAGAAPRLRRCGPVCLAAPGGGGGGCSRPGGAAWQHVISAAPGASGHCAGSRRLAAAHGGCCRKQLGTLASSRGGRIRSLHR